MVGVDVVPDKSEKSLVEVGIELEALQSEDYHHNHQATGPDNMISMDPVVLPHYFSYGTVRQDLIFFAETYGTYHLMAFCTLPPGETRFQL